MGAAEGQPRRGVRMVGAAHRPESTAGGLLIARVRSRPVPRSNSNTRLSFGSVAKNGKPDHVEVRHVVE